MKTKNPLSGILVAPRAGFEPATNRLHESQCFQRAWTISSPRKGGRRFPGFLRVLPWGIVSEPFLRFLSGLGCWLPTALRLGFQQFTFFSIWITPESCLWQSTALPLSYRGISLICGIRLSGVIVQNFSIVSTSLFVDPRRFELLTSRMPCERSTSWAMGPFECAQI